MISDKYLGEIWKIENKYHLGKDDVVTSLGNKVGHVYVSKELFSHNHFKRDFGVKINKKQ